MRTSLKIISKKGITSQEPSHSWTITFQITRNVTAIHSLFVINSKRNLIISNVKSLKYSMSPLILNINKTRTKNKYSFSEIF